MSLHVTSVGFLLLVWPFAEATSLASHLKIFTDDWTQGHSGLCSALFAILQVLVAPVRFLWRCWCRWAVLIFWALFWPLFYSLVWPLILLYGLCLGSCIGIERLHKMHDRPLKPQSDSPSTTDHELQSIHTGPYPGHSMLEEVLSMDDLFYELVKNAHAVDLLRLGMASKTTRNIVQRHWASRACQKYLCNGSPNYCWVSSQSPGKVALAF